MTEGHPPSPHPTSRETVLCQQDIWGQNAAFSPNSGLVPASWTSPHLRHGHETTQPAGGSSTILVGPHGWGQAESQSLDTNHPLSSPKTQRDLGGRVKELGKL